MRTLRGQSRKSIPAFPSLYHERTDNLNVHMFTEDVHLRVMPIGGRRLNDGQFAVVLKGTDQACSRARHLLASLARYERHDPVRLVCDVVNEIALYLAWRGRAVYELVKGSKEDDFPISLHHFIVDPGFWTRQ